MATMNVSLSDQMKAWVESQAETGRYANASDYVRDLIRRDQERSAKITALESLIDEGLARGDPQPLDPDGFLARMRAQHTERHGGKGLCAASCGRARPGRDLELYGADLVSSAGGDLFPQALCSVQSDCRRTGDRAPSKNTPRPWETCASPHNQPRLGRSARSGG